MIAFVFFFAELIIFLPFSVWITYFFIYAIGYRFFHTELKKVPNQKNKYLVIFPAYKEDAVIVDSVLNFLLQKYPKSLYEVVVVADSLEETTLMSLYKQDVKVLVPTYTKRSKAAALKLAMNSIAVDTFDAVVILDADNHVDVDFLERIDEVFGGNNRVIQVRRVAKNQKTDIAYLDGLSEDINNSIFRQGHNNLGLPAALSGSGMVFEIEWFKSTMHKIDSVGEDKELEYFLLKDRINTIYLDAVYVYDEKVNKNKDLSNQRKRWIAAQLDVFVKLFKELPSILKTKNWAMLDKLIQWSMPPRILLLGWGPLWMGILCFFDPSKLDKWLVLYSLFFFSLLLALPNRYYSIRTLGAVIKLPSIFIAILRSYTGLKSAKTTFIHTSHGKEEDHNH